MRSSALPVVLVFAGCISGRETPGKDQPTPEPLAGAQGPSVTSDVDRGYVGVLTPDKSAEITAPFTTTVSEFLVNLGDHVEVGDKIAVLDDKPLLEELAIARAELKGHRAEVAQASVSRSAAKAALRREKLALKEQVSSRADVDAAGFKSREAGTMVAHAAASVEEQKARIAQLEAKLVDMTVTAPIAGKVSLRYVEPGSRVEEGQPVVRVISTNALLVKFAIPADQMGKVTPGEPIDVLIDAGGARIAGVVKSVSPELDAVAQMILAEAELTEGLPDSLQSGMVCRVVPRGGAHPAPAPTPAIPSAPPAAAAATAPPTGAATPPTDPAPAPAAPAVAAPATATVPAHAGDAPPTTAAPAVPAAAGAAPPAAATTATPAGAAPAGAAPAPSAAADPATAPGPAGAEPAAAAEPDSEPPASPAPPAHGHHRRK